MGFTIYESNKTWFVGLYCCNTMNSSMQTDDISFTQILAESLHVPRACLFSQTLPPSHSNAGTRYVGKCWLLCTHSSKLLAATALPPMVTDAASSTFLIPYTYYGCIRPCWQMLPPPHSLHLSTKRLRPCWQMLAPPHSLHRLRWHQSMLTDAGSSALLAPTAFWSVPTHARLVPFAPFAGCRVFRRSPFRPTLCTGTLLARLLDLHAGNSLVFFTIVVFHKLSSSWGKFLLRQGILNL